MSAAAMGARILVVDDDRDLLALITMRLQSAGYTVAQAASGEEALEIFREWVMARVSSGDDCHSSSLK